MILTAVKRVSTVYNAIKKFSAFANIDIQTEKCEVLSLSSLSRKIEEWSCLQKTISRMEDYREKRAAGIPGVGQCQSFLSMLQGGVG